MSRGPQPPEAASAGAPEAISLDTRGLKCPMPVIQLARAALPHPGGTTVTVLADDPAARADIPAWCRMKGHSVAMAEEERHTVFTVVLGR